MIFQLTIILLKAYKFWYALIISTNNMTFLWLRKLLYFTASVENIMSLWSSRRAPTIRSVIQLRSVPTETCVQQHHLWLQCTVPVKVLVNCLACIFSENVISWYSSRVNIQQGNKWKTCVWRLFLEVGVVKFSCWSFKMVYLSLSLKCPKLWIDNFIKNHR